MTLHSEFHHNEFNDSARVGGFEQKITDEVNI